MDKTVKRTLTVILIAAGVLVVLFAIFWGTGYLLFHPLIDP